MLHEKITRLELELERKQHAMKAQMEIAKMQMDADEMEMKDRIDDLKRQYARMEIRRKDVYESRTP